MTKQVTAEEKICCLIPPIDFPKARLLANISKEEGATLVEFRVPLAQSFLPEDLVSNLKIKTILAVEPQEYHLPLSATIKEEKKDNHLKRITSLLKEMILLKPFAVELNLALTAGFLTELSFEAKQQGVETVVAKYFDNFPAKGELLATIEKGLKFKPAIMKIIAPAETEFNSLEMLTLYKEKKEAGLVALCSGNKGRISQILAPFSGAEFTYAYLSRESGEAQISLQLLKKAFQTLTMCLTY